MKRSLEYNGEADPDEPPPKRCKATSKTISAISQRDSVVTTLTPLDDTLDDHEPQDDDILPENLKRIDNKSTSTSTILNVEDEKQSNVVIIQISNEKETFNVTELKQSGLSYFEARLDKRWNKNNNTSSSKEDIISIDGSCKGSLHSLGFTMKDFKILLDIKKNGKISFKYPCTKEFLQPLLFCNDFFGRDVISENMLIDYLSNYKPGITFKERKEWVLSVKNEFLKSVLISMNEKCLASNREAIAVAKEKTSRQKIIGRFTMVDDETLVSLFIKMFDFEIENSHNWKGVVNVSFPNMTHAQHDVELLGTPRWWAGDIWFQIKHRKLHEKKCYWDKIYQHLQSICQRYKNIDDEINKTREAGVNCNSKNVNVCVDLSDSEEKSDHDHDVCFGFAGGAQDVHQAMFDIAWLIHNDRNKSIDNNSNNINTYPIKNKLNQDNSLNEAKKRTGDDQIQDQSQKEKKFLFEQLVILCFDWMVKSSCQYTNAYDWYKNIIPLLTRSTVRYIFKSMIENNMVKQGTIKLFDLFVKYGEMSLENKHSNWNSSSNKIDNIDDDFNFRSLIQHESFLRSWFENLWSKNNEWQTQLQTNLSKEEITSMFVKSLESKTLIFKCKILSFFVQYGDINVVFQNETYLDYFVKKYINAYGISSEFWWMDQFLPKILTKRQVSLLLLKIMEHNPFYFKYVYKSVFGNDGRDRYYGKKRILKFLNLCDISLLMNHDKEAVNISNVLIKLVINEAYTSHAVDGCEWMELCLGKGLLDSSQSMLILKQLHKQCPAINDWVTSDWHLTPMPPVMMLQMLLVEHCEYRYFDQIKNEFTDFLCTLMKIVFIKQNAKRHEYQREQLRLQQNEASRCLKSCENIILQKLSPVQVEGIFLQILDDKKLKRIFRADLNRMMRYLECCCKERVLSESLVTAMYDFMVKQVFVIAGHNYDFDDDNLNEKNMGENIQKWMFDTMMKRILMPREVSKLAIKFLKSESSPLSLHSSPMHEYSNPFKWECIRSHTGLMDRFISCVMNTCDKTWLFCNEDDEFAKKLILFLLIQNEKFQSLFLKCLETATSDSSTNDIEQIAIQVAKVIWNSVPGTCVIDQKLMNWINEKIGTDFVSTRSVIAQESMWPNNV